MRSVISEMVHGLMRFLKLWTQMVSWGAIFTGASVGEVETFYLKQLSNKCVGVTYRRKTTLMFLELDLFKPLRYSFSSVVHPSNYYITRAQFHFFDKMS